MKKIIIILALISTLTACTSVDSGNRGVKITWGGKTDLSQTYGEGMYWGLEWISNSMENYDVREKTFKAKYQFNDKNNMATGVEIALDYSFNPEKVHLLHTKIGKENINIKIQKTLQSAAKEVIPQYSASELNLSKRDEAESKITTILSRELPQIYIQFARVQMTDVDIPKTISDAAELTAKQTELNNLSEKKVLEEENKFKAAEWTAKTNQILSQPQMLKLKELEIDLEYAKKGVSKYGTNNVFGTNTGILLNK